MMISATVAMPIVAMVLLFESALSIVLETLPVTPYCRPLPLNAWVAAVRNCCTASSFFFSSFWSAQLVGSGTTTSWMR